MAQSLLIGLGGTGSRVVNNVAKELQKNGKTINNGEMFCAVLDTNVNDAQSIEDSATGIPVIPTSKAQKIRDYLHKYQYLHMEDWCPKNPVFLEQTMLDGASELRMKSRIAFMDCMEDNVMKELETMINEVLKNNDRSKIRIMIVSSLSGGTGSGMFIQVALWLRKILSESDISIRGIFLLPDVFVDTIEDIQQNRSTSMRHYCNAYAAVRELNALDTIRKHGAKGLTERITLDSVFDSDAENGEGKAVYDLAFFVDSKDTNGVRLDDIGAYEKMVAQLVYMQLYAPMKTDMYSEEDNLFLKDVESEEPLYGSCGTSKAVYPVENVKTYCAIRAAQDAIAKGWRKIDDEIDALKEEKKQAEKDGIFTPEVIDERETFIRLFDEKIAVKPEEVGKDRFFLTISKDIRNETRVKTDDGKTVVQESDKVRDFLELLKRQTIDTAITRYAENTTAIYAQGVENFASLNHTMEGLLNQIADDESGLEEVLNTFDTKVESMAEAIVNGVFPYSMGDIKASKACSVYGLMTKKDSMDNFRFVHPVAVRYMLYKLVGQMTRELEGIVLVSSRANALTGGDVGTKFDNKSTPMTETSPEEYLKSKKWYQMETKFIDVFEEKYEEFIVSKIALCEKYEKECLQVAVYKGLIARINGLIKHMEAFFQKLDAVQEKLSRDLAENLSECAGIVGKTVYVYSTPANKEALYEDLDFADGSNHSQINRQVLNAVYGSYCAEKRPSTAENAPYANVSVVTSFLAETIRTFRQRMTEDKEIREQVDLDIYTAICRDSDARFRAMGGSDQPADSLEGLDLATGVYRKMDQTDLRHSGAFKEMKDQLYRMAAPFLIHDPESPDENGATTERNKTFWGFHTEVANAYKGIGRELGINADIQADSAYPRNELYCYRANYGVRVVNIPKFNEMQNGLYYASYQSIISKMEKEAAGRAGERAYVLTPHLNMYWHKLLPYITREKQTEEELQFCRGFWLAVAYGAIRLDKDGNFLLRRAVDDGYGKLTSEDAAVIYKDKPVAKTDVRSLLEALKQDRIFVETDMPRLEARLEEELASISTYVGTDVLQGLTQKNEDLHPVTMVSRYHESPYRDPALSRRMVGALEQIAAQLAARYSTDRSERKLEEASLRICRRIYDSSKRVKGRGELFGGWEDRFAKYKIKEEPESTGGNASL